MINPEKFYNTFKENGINSFYGVPDSLLKNFCAFIEDHESNNNHIITANEGSAIAYAVGSFLATKKPSLVYLQNSGLGNCINPLLSIADDKVYGIPMILLIGWRGMPGIHDEPQHIRQGEVTVDLIKAMKLDYKVINSSVNFDLIIKEAINTSIKNSKPFVLLVEPNTFESYKLIKKTNTEFKISRENAIKTIVQNINSDDVIVSTTGKTSRELFEIRKSLGQTHEKDFLTVGGMGHTSSIAMGISLKKPDKTVYCLDGDGSLLMHMGSIAVFSNLYNVHNFKHIILNNGAHESVGGQSTVAQQINLPEIAKNCRYTFIDSINNENEFINKFEKFKNHRGIAFLEINLNTSSRKDLGRPTKKPTENKVDLMNFLH